jgi:outer membrane protein assembly factor BamB
MLKHLSLIAITLFAPVLSVSRADWPQFRGPEGNGYVTTGANPERLGLPTTWSETENVRWKTEIPYKGWSSPVIMNGQVWLTTATEDGHDFFVICVDAKSGKILLDKKLFHCDQPEPLGNPVNTYASPSPAIEPGRVYVHFGSYGTACVDTSNFKVLWQRDDLPCRHYRGPSSSVVLFENLVILTFDGVDQQYIVALDTQTGDNVWKTNRDVQWHDQDLTGKSPDAAKRALDGDMRKAHSTPLVAKLPNGDPLLLSCGAMSSFAYDPRNGKERWRIVVDDFSVSPRPIYHSGIAYMLTGNIHPEMWAVRAEAKGDLTETDNVLWRTKQGVSHTSSPILVDDLIYMANDDGVIRSFDVKSGKLVWQKRAGSSYAASPIFADGHLYFCDRDGQSTVIKPGRKFESVATNTLDDGLMASPAVDGRALYLRTKTHLYRIEGPTAPPTSAATN